MVWEALLSGTITAMWILIPLLAIAFHLLLGYLGLALLIATMDREFSKTSRGILSFLASPFWVLKIEDDWSLVIALAILSTYTVMCGGFGMFGSLFFLLIYRDLRSLIIPTIKDALCPASQ